MSVKASVYIEKTDTRAEQAPSRRQGPSLAGSLGCLGAKNLPRGTPPGRDRVGEQGGARWRFSALRERREFAKAAQRHK
jgi:hypothetical protein